MVRASASFLLSFICAAAIAGPLHDAARDGDVEQARALIDAGTNLDETSDNGETPLNLAILAGHEALALVLIDRGADIAARNEGGFTPLHAAAYVNSVDIAERLLDMGGDIHDRENKAGVSPLNVASEEGQADVVRLLIERGADVEAGDRNGYTALTRALWRGHEEVVMLLHRAGAKCQPVEILDEPAYSQCMEGQQ